MTPEPSFELTHIERQSPLWAKLAAHFERRIAQLNRLNEGDLPDAKTANLRGRIAELRSLAELANEIPRFPAAPE